MARIDPWKTNRSWNPEVGKAGNGRFGLLVQLSIQLQQWHSSIRDAGMKKKSLSLIIDILCVDEKVALKKLRDRLGPAIYDKPLITLGKIVIALAAIVIVLGGLVDVIQGLISLGSGGEPVASFLWIIFLGSLRIALGYGLYMLLDMRKSGLIVSIAKFFAILSAGIMIIITQFMIIIGFLSLSDPPLLGGFLLLSGGIMFCAGLGVIYFIDEREKLQKMQKPEKSG